MQFRRSFMMLMVVIAAVSLVFFTPANVAKAAPPSSPDMSIYLCVVTLTFTSAPGASYDFQVWDDGVIVSSSSATGTGGDISLSNTINPYAGGAPGVGLVLVENGGTVWVLDPYVPTECATRGAKTFYNPGDGRVDPRPGDRVAVYCSADKVSVYGVMNDSRGLFLATFTHADLIKAGAAGITKKVEPRGTVIISLTGTSNLYVRWTGGPAAATGVKDFAKAFTCALS
jgi:hypothetical protein